LENIPGQTEGTPGFGTQVVGQKLPNELGTYDMSGNVTEWCSDWHGSAYPADTADPANNPKGPAAGSSRLIRGGYWSDDEFACRLSIRGYNYNPSIRLPDVGFRIAISL
jgi:formylglycine-generating enzyme required for sulfatase activity